MLSVITSYFPIDTIIRLCHLFSFTDYAKVKLEIAVATRKYPKLSFFLIYRRFVTVKLEEDTFVSVILLHSF